MVDGLHCWDKSLETGHEEIDSQHKMLVSTYNGFIEALRRGEAADEILKTVDFLSGYAFMHFEMEEGLQLRTGYPDYVKHKFIHDDFRLTLEGLVQRFREEGPTEELVDFVTKVVGDRLLIHLKGEDYEMATYVKSRI